MQRFSAWLVALAAIALSSAGCEPPKPADAAQVGPSPELTQRAVLALLPGLQFGADPALDAYREIRAAEVAGAHFVPASNRWVVHYCVEYASFASEAPARRCDLGVELYELDTKKWIALARGAGTLYRWQVLDTAASPVPENAASAPAPLSRPRPPSSPKPSTTP